MFFGDGESRDVKDTIEEFLLGPATEAFISLIRGRGKPVFCRLSFGKEAAPFPEKNI